MKQMKKKGRLQRKVQRSHLSYISKVTLVCILLISIPFTAAIVITGVHINNYLSQSAQERVNQSIDYLNKTLEQYFISVREITILPLFDNNLQAVMLKHADPANPVYLTFDDQRRVLEILSSLSYERDTVRRTDLYLRDGNRLNNGSSVLKWSEAERDWMDLCDADPYRTFILSWRGTLIMARALQEPMTKRPLGYIKVVLNEETIKNIVMMAYLPEESQVAIYNDHEQCLYPLDITVAPLMSPMDLSEPGYVVGYTTSEATGLNVVARVSTHSMEKDIRDLLGFAALVVGVSLIASWCFALAASFKLAKPIVNLKNKMALVAEGRFSTRLVVQSQDEIGQLEGMFNSMTESVETLIHEVYETQLASKEAQISALQSQINPHFLYNSLETINMLALARENYEVSEAVSDLGQMMHYCVSNEQHFATLQDEIDFVTAYFHIQKLRFENLRSLQIDIASEHRRLLVPKLLLQPFVENIVQHGIGNDELDIVLNIGWEGEALMIAIQNSGNPLSEESQQMVRQKLFEAEQEPANKPWQPTLKKGYGLSNVHRRLRLIYGEECGVALDENFMAGARFVLRLRPGLHGGWGGPPKE